MAFFRYRKRLPSGIVQTDQQPIITGEK